MALLARHLKDVYKVLVSPESVNLPSWRLGKLKSQSKRFTKEKLEDIIGELASIDVETKTSDASVVELLDILIIGKLK